MVAALTLAVAVATTGCGGGDPTEREYALPDTLCGLDVPRDLYAPLFPPGSDLSTERFSALPSDNIASLDHCLIEVGGELAIWSDATGDDTFPLYMSSRYDPLFVYEREESLEYDMADGTPVDGEFEAMVWPGFAIAGTSCRPGENINSFTVGIRADYPEDEEESVRVLSALIQPFMRAAVDSSICEPGDNRESDYSSP
jgi:hypothetical protein